MSVEISEAEFESILVEKRQLQANLTACQKLCNEQLEEIRRLRKMVEKQDEDNDPEAWKLECGT